MSNINYVFGNTIRIYRLPNIGDIKKNETYLNIAKIKIYDENNVLISESDISGITASSVYNNNIANYGPRLAIDNNIFVQNDKFFYHSAEGDNAPWIQIQLNKNIKISKIKIYRRPGYDRITNAFVRIKNSNDEVLSDDKITSINTDYVFGNTIRIYRLLNEGDISRRKETYLNIAEIKIYNDKNKLLNSSDISGITARTIYNNDNTNYGPQLAIDNNISVVGQKKFYHSAKDDNEPWIQIQLNKNIKISKINIYRRPTYDRITNAIVRIKNSNDDILSDDKIYNFQSNKPVTIIPDNIEITIIPVNTYCTNSANNFSSKCYTGMNVDNISTINQCINKVNGIITKVELTDKLIDSLFKDQSSYSQHILDLNSMSIKVLSTINNSLIDEVKKLPPMPEIVRIKESFTNSNIKKNININSNMNMNQNSVFSSINSNDVSQYGKTLKDKHIEKFADFIQPKLNIYENFGNWESDVNSSKFNLEYIAPSNDKDLNRNKITSVIPVIKKTNMEKDLNETTAKILAINMNRKSNILINNWKKM